MSLALRSALVLALSLGPVSGCGDNPTKPPPLREYSLAFATPAPVTANGVDSGSQLLVADVNVDGRADIVATRDSSKVWVGFGSSGGSFGNSGSYAAGVTPIAIASGDLNGDSRGDIVVAGAGAITALWGQAQGFSDPETLVVIDNGGVARQVACGEFDGDGYSDLCFIFEWYLFYNTPIFSLGMASSGSTYHQYDGVWNMPLTVGDVSGDGKSDVVGTTWGATQAWVYVYIGNGDGSLQPAVTKPTAQAPSRAVVMDLDEVGPGGDLSLGHRLTDGKVGVLPWKNSELQAESTYTAGNAITSVASADLNADGKQDVAAASSGTNSVGVLLGNGDGSLRFPADFNVGASPQQIAVGDVDGDGLVDIVTITSSGIVLLRNTSAP